MLINMTVFVTVWVPDDTPKEDTENLTLHFNNVTIRGDKYKPIPNSEVISHETVEVSKE